MELCTSGLSYVTVHSLDSDLLPVSDDKGEEDCNGRNGSPGT